MLTGVFCVGGSRLKALCVPSEATCAPIEAIAVPRNNQHTY